MTYEKEVDKKTGGEKWLVDRKMNEQNCDNKTQTKTELEWHGDKYERGSVLSQRPLRMDRQQ